MLTEAINKIVELGQDTFRPQIQRPDCEPNYVYYLTTKDGTSRIEAAAAPRQHQAGDIEALAALAENHGNATVWYNRGGVIALLDDTTRRDKVTLTLTPSPEIQCLAGLNSNSWLSQAEFLKLLRIQLRSVLAGAAEQLMHTIRRVKFRQNEEGHREIQQTKASLGRSIEAELTCSDNIPEDVFLHVNVWQGVPGISTSVIRCFIEVDPMNQKFAIFPAPGEIERAFREAEIQLGEILRARLKGSSDCVYFGKP